MSEVAGVLMRVEEQPDGSRRLHVVRRSGEVVEVAEQDVLRYRLIPSAKGSPKAPASWEENR